MEYSILYKIILSFFVKITNKDTELIKLLTSSTEVDKTLSGLVYKEGCLGFNLDGLYQRLINNNPNVTPELSVSYQDFRKALYESDLNTQLAKQGYIIKVCSQNTKVSNARGPNTRAKVDTNWYELVPLET